MNGCSTWMRNLIFTWEVGGNSPMLSIFSNCLAFGFQVAIKCQTNAPWNEQTQHQHLTWSCLKTKSLSKEAFPSFLFHCSKKWTFLFTLSWCFVFFFRLKKKTCSWGFTNSHGQVVTPMFFKTPPRYRKEILAFSNQGAQANSSFGSRAPNRKIIGPTLGPGKFLWNLPTKNGISGICVNKRHICFQNDGPRTAWFGKKKRFQVDS